MAFKVISKTVKNPLIKTIGNTIKTPIIKTFGNTIKNSVSTFRRKKSAIKHLACGLQEKYLRTIHNIKSRSVKYLGEEGIKNSKHIAP